MADQSAEIQQHAQQALQTLDTMEQRLRQTQQDVQKLPFLARGFVERELKSATGRSFNDWLAGSTQLRRALSPLLSAGAAAVSARTAIEDELPRLASLRTFLQKVPERANSVPAAILKPAQRAEFVGRVQEQTAGLGQLDSELRALSSLLSAGA